ncbi:MULTISPECIES: WXG100 family type VII secretion target [unclassified Plantibacter]|uniref:WXG100 family type VII secretion target n=1 Tax=unclassified Plantibacter TaxID=2624265 RepID=UPI003D34BFBE
MYGDTQQIRLRAAEFRTLASDVRTRATQLRAATGLEWTSTAADRFTEDLTEQATKLDASARQLDDAATKLDAHADAVDHVKQAIEDAARWVGDRWHDATKLVGGAVETVKDGVGKVFEFFGQEVPDFLVHQAKEIVSSTPALPSPGSKDWLDLSDLYRNRGWTP